MIFPDPIPFAEALAAPADREPTETDTHHRLLEALQILPLPDRQLLRAVYYDNRSYSAIGRALDLSHEAIRQRHRKAFRKLRHYLTEQPLRTPPAPHQCLSVSISG